MGGKCHIHDCRGGKKVKKKRGESDLIPYQHEAGATDNPQILEKGGEEEKERATILILNENT